MGSVRYPQGPSFLVSTGDLTPLGASGLCGLCLDRIESLPYWGRRDRSDTIAVNRMRLSKEWSLAEVADGIRGPTGPEWEIGSRRSSPTEGRRKKRWRGVPPPAVAMGGQDAPLSRVLSYWQISRTNAFVMLPSPCLRMQTLSRPLASTRTSVSISLPAKTSAM